MPSEEFRCKSCIHGVLTGVLPSGISEYACCREHDTTPFFYYDANPERVADCVEYRSLRRKPRRRKASLTRRGESYYVAE